MTDGPPMPPGLKATRIPDGVTVDVAITEELCPPEAVQMIAEAYPGDDIADTFRREMTTISVAAIMAGRAQGVGGRLRIVKPDSFYALQAEFLRQSPASVPAELDGCTATAVAVVKAIIGQRLPTHNTAGRA